MTHRAKKQAIREFMQRCYSDQNLASLLAHSRDAKLALNSCCCFIGIPTADHALRGKVNMMLPLGHYVDARLLPGANSAEFAFMTLGEDSYQMSYDAKRRRILIPMVRAEMKRRQFVHENSGISQDVAVSLAV